MAGRCRLLVALTPMGHVHARRALQAAFDLLAVFSLQQAIIALKDGGIDAILCSIHFDESRMFNLLTAAVELAPSVPFVCCAMLDSRLRPAYVESLIAAAKSNGARAFIDYNGMQRSLGFPEADGRFRDELLRLVGGECGQTGAANG